MLELRDFPYPYKALLAVCSDLDETPSAEAYFEISRYLNTDENTAVGRGVNLEVGNTLYFYMPPGQFSYGDATETEQRLCRALIRSGHIDCLHSYGDLATSRAQVGVVLEELARYDCRVPVWVDHGTAVTNLGRDIMQGFGDVPGHAAYHADLTVQHGVRHVWLGRVTSCLGQNAPYDPLQGFAESRRFGALVNGMRDTAKLLRGKLGDNKYSLHANNRLTRKYTLRDNQQTSEFIRCNPHPFGVSAGDDAQGLGSALHDSALQALVRRRGVSVIYTHLGKHAHAPSWLPEQTREGFERLATYHERGDILVTTTSRLLDYEAAKSVATLRNGDGGAFELVLPDHLPADGLSWYTDGSLPEIYFRGKVLSLLTNEPDETGRPSCSVLFPPLSFPELA